MKVPFNRPAVAGNELEYIQEAIKRGQLSGDGYFTKECHRWLEKEVGCKKALLTHSCTAALEMAAILADIQPGDEVIMPSYTFVSTANAFVLRGGIPVFVDIRPDTMNIDESLIETAITEKTRAIVPVHYAGVSCEMDTIMQLAKKYNLLVIEDAAQGIMSKYKGRPLGSMGHMAAFSFHETKNISCGEGGALLINDSLYIDRAEIIREKGTNRSKFFRGEVDKYTWVDIGSSYLPGEMNAAFLYAQMENASKITDRRLQIWDLYFKGLEPLAVENSVELPFIPDYCVHNAHMFYIKVKNQVERASLIKYLKAHKVNSVFHYIPLHSSEKGRSYLFKAGEKDYTNRESERLLRLPLYYDLGKEKAEKVVKLIFEYFTGK